MSDIAKNLDQLSIDTLRILAVDTVEKEIGRAHV